MRSTAVLFLGFFASATQGLQRAIPILGYSGLAEYRPGDLPIILTSPHGGYLDHPGIPDRMFGCKNNVTGECEYKKDPACIVEGVCKVITRGDAYTNELTLIAAEQIEEELGARPHVIISHLMRAKLDPNRDIVQAAQGNVIAEAAYRDFHGFIDTAKMVVREGFLVDMHGQCLHSNTTAQVGFLINTSELNDGVYNAWNSSIKHMAERSDASGQELISGKTSLGGLLEEQGFDAVPSPREPSPGDEKYLRGGFITREHGSLNGGAIDAIQMETHARLKNGVTNEERLVYGKAIGRAIVQYFKIHYAEHLGFNVLA